MFQNALRMFLNAFQHFQMRCAEKRLNAIFIKPGFPKEGHNFKMKFLYKRRQTFVKTGVL